jgi:predicted oxidoreductase
MDNKVTASAINKVTKEWVVRRAQDLVVKVVALTAQRDRLLEACEAAQIMLLQTDWNGDERMNIVEQAIAEAKPAKTETTSEQQ